jgi:hypothetical protein
MRNAACSQALDYIGFVPLWPKPAMVCRSRRRGVQRFGETE